MRIEDYVYFAPGVRFDQVNFDSPDLPELFVRRIDGYYLQPAHLLLDAGHAFGAGVLLVACIDALARLKIGGGVGDRFREYAHDELPSFSAGGLAHRFYDDFRNGLVHEGRIKLGGQFSLETTKTVEHDARYLVINPAYLFIEVKDALMRDHAMLMGDAAARTIFANLLKADYAHDIQAAKARVKP